MKTLNYEMLDKMDCNDFVNICQNCLNNYYLSRPDYSKIYLSLGVKENDIMDYIQENIEWDIFQEKYREFLSQKMDDGTYKYQTWWSEEEQHLSLACWLGLSDEEPENYDEDVDSFYAYFLETNSGWGYDAFLEEMIDYFELENEWIEKCGYIELSAKLLENDEIIILDEKCLKHSIIDGKPEKIETTYIYYYISDYEFTLYVKSKIKDKNNNIIDKNKIYEKSFNYLNIKQIIKRFDRNRKLERIFA